MAAPAIAAQIALNQIQRRFPGGVPGAIAVTLIITLLPSIFVVFMMLSSVMSVFSSAANSCTVSDGGSSTASPIALKDIPQSALEAYQNAGKATGIDWVYLAGIGKVETSHGTYAGSKPDTNGNVRPKIIGIALNGSNGTRAIRDTDNGSYDNDRTWDRAVGPMQFIPTTWEAMKRDGNGDGVQDPHNLYDTAMAAAYYLKRSGAPQNMRQAIFAYNNADWYVDKVMAAADSYRDTGGSGRVAAYTTANTSMVQAAQGDKKTNKEVTDSGWVQPMKKGYTLTARFGSGGGLWSSGSHTGLDYAAPVGTAVFAAGGGIVTVRGDQGWAGPNFVTIDHLTFDGRIIQTWYAHMSAATVRSGQRVVAGQQIGSVGSEGNSTGPHLHFEVRVNGEPTDPEVFLATAGAPSGAVVGSGCAGDVTGLSSGTPGNGAWGGYENGKIPESELCPLGFERNVLMRCDAAEALTMLNAAYKQRFGVNVGPVGGYRDYAGQVLCRQQKGSLCAVPGTSNHGWGMAADLAGDGINNFGTPQHQWMKANAHTYGWIHPNWAQAGGSKPEPWHWEFGNIS